MGSFNARPMTVSLFESIRTLALARCKQRLHLLPGVQGQAAPSCSCTEGPTGADLAITSGKLHLDQRFACILNRGPAGTDPALRTGDLLSFPINGEVRQVVASL